MTLLDRLAQLPDTALVPVGWLRELLAAETGARGSPTSDDRDPAGIPGTPPASTNGERMLSAEEVAERLGVSVRWCYDHQDQLGGKRLSRRCLRFPEVGVRRYVERRR